MLLRSRVIPFLLPGADRLTRTRTRSHRKFSHKFRIGSLLFVEIFPSVKFRFFPYIVMAHRSQISHYSGIYLTWSSFDFFSVSVVEEGGHLMKWIRELKRWWNCSLVRDFAICKFSQFIFVCGMFISELHIKFFSCIS